MKDNFVIEVFDLKHGEIVKDFFISLGVVVSGYQFSSTKENEDELRFYGLHNGNFDNYHKTYVKKNNLEVYTLRLASKKEKELINSFGVEADIYKFSSTKK